MVKAKPDPTGQRFGRLVVIGKGDRTPTLNKGYETSIQLYICQCDCCNVIQRKRCVFEKKTTATPSCGCYKNERIAQIGRQKLKSDLTGQVFGQLTVLGRSNLKSDHSSMWRLQCSCGKIIHRVRGDFEPDGRGRMISCGCAVRRGLTSRKMGRKLTYPSTPTPYPEESAAIVSKYLHLIQSNHNQNYAQTEDEKMIRLVRSAFIISYRRRWGENISEKREKLIIKRYLRFASLAARRKENRRKNGYFLYDEKEQFLIGGEVTNSTLFDYPVSESETPGTFLVKFHKKRIKFSRC